MLAGGWHLLAKVALSQGIQKRSRSYTPPLYYNSTQEAVMQKHEQALNTTKDPYVQAWVESSKREGAKHCQLLLYKTSC